MESPGYMKQYKKIFLLFLLIVCLSSLIAPLIKALLDTLVISNPFVSDLLSYRQGSYDFGKVMRRIMMVVAIFIIFLFRKSLMIGSLSTMNLRHTRDRWKLLQIGFFLGTGIFSLYIALLYAVDARILHVDATSFGNLILQLIEALFIACLVACIEEIFFRGFIFQSFRKDMSAILAVCITSIFYSSLHFLKIKLAVTPGIQPFVGFLVFYQFLKNLIINFPVLYPSIIGLFLVGVVLSYACLRTNSLYLAIGLHAGWVFLIKTDHLFFDRIKGNREWLFGDNNVVTGILAWLLMIITLIIIRFITRTLPKEALPHTEYR